MGEFRKLFINYYLTGLVQIWAERKGVLVVILLKDLFLFNYYELIRGFKFLQVLLLELVVVCCLLKVNVIEFNTIGPVVENYCVNGWLEKHSDVLDRQIRSFYLDVVVCGKVSLVELQHLIQSLRLILSKPVILMKLWALVDVLLLTCLQLFLYDLVSPDQNKLTFVLVENYFTHSLHIHRHHCFLRFDLFNLVIRSGW